LARCRINLGVLLRNVGRSGDCLRQYTDAIQLLRELVEQQPSESEYVVELSQALLNLGNLLLSARTETPPLVSDSLAEAAGAFESAVQLLEQLTAEYPNVPLYHIQLASALNGVGGVQQEREEVAAAEQSWQRAKHAFERVLSLSGESADVRSRLGLTLSNLALLVPKEQSERKLPLLQEACEQQRMALRITPDAAPIRGYLRSHLLSLARACLQVGRFSQAATAALELEQLAVQRGDGRVAADLLVRAAVGLGADESVSAEEREAQSVEWQGRAVEMLGRAVVAGVLKREDLRVDERFAALREHPQFRVLLDSDGPQ
jgi:tetratricopeptide (TPR) repeat protein